VSEAYQRHFAEVYDRLMMEDMPYDEWQRFIREAWSRYDVHPRTVVDLGCGTGRHTVTFARDGLEMIGIDLSEHMLMAAHEHAEESKTAIQAVGGSLRWLQQDMREWGVGREVDAVVCLCDGINYMLSDRDVQAVFQRTYEALRKGGLFVFDVLTQHQYETYAAGQPYTYDDDDVAYIWYSDWDADQRIIQHELTMFVQQDEDSELYMRIQEMHEQRAYSVDDLTAWLQEAGFGQIDMFADYRWERITDRTSRVSICALK